MANAIVTTILAIGTKVNIPNTNQVATVGLHGVPLYVMELRKMYPSKRFTRIQIKVDIR